MTTLQQDWRVEQRKASKKLKALLIEPALTQRAIAEYLGMSDDQVSNYLLARRRWPEGFEQNFKDAVSELSK